MADNPTIQDEEYTYDAVGNRLTSEQTTGDWTYNQNNELETGDDATYEYDANGNMIRKTENTVITNYVYNEEDRLIEVRDGSNILIASYYYDPFGRRLWKEVGEVKTCFAYADEGLIGEYNATGAEIRSYGYRPGSTWTTDPIFMKENGTYYFYQNDHLGTPQKLTAVNGSIVWSATYESFGKAQVDGTSTVTNNLRFPGQYYDEETGLHYNYFRYYNPGVGRYLRVDPILQQFLYVESEMKFVDYAFILPGFVRYPEMISYYSYSLSNPLSYWDSQGYGLTDFIRCFYLGAKISKLQDQCKNEIGSSFDEECKFYEKYGSGLAPSDVIWNCVESKDPNLYSKWVKSCFKGGYGPGAPAKPKPSPR